MVDITCSICLEQLRSPVSIPCGHIHCGKCLTAHIGSGSDAIRSTCPTCRTPFSIVKPDLAYVPKKFHEFMLPSVRKIYLDTTSESAELKAQIAQLEARVKSLTKDKALLMDKCEGNMAAVKAHAEGERQAKQDAEIAREEAEDIRKKYKSMKNKYDKLKRQKDADLDASSIGPALKRKSSEVLHNSRSPPSPIGADDESSRFSTRASRCGVSSQDLSGTAWIASSSPPRPMRALPRSARTRGRLPSLPEIDLDPPPVFRKRPRFSAPASHKGESSMLQEDKEQDAVEERRKRFTDDPWVELMR